MIFSNTLRREFNDMASLSFNTLELAIRNLFHVKETYGSFFFFGSFEISFILSFSGGHLARVLDEGGAAGTQHICAGQPPWSFAWPVLT